MKTPETDIVIVGAGPVGLMCAYLGQLCGLRTVVLDKSAEPLQVGRADALNARTLQLLELAGLFDDLYPLGKKCNTSSVWANGNFVSRQSTWWDSLEGCFHKHFLMLGQAFVEQGLDAKLKVVGAPVRRCTPVVNVELASDGCLTTLENGETISSRFVIGADGSRSRVRELFKVPFEITRPQIVWAVIDGVIETTFPKVPEIIVFQAETSDVAWIPREGNIDRFYVRMDTREFTVDEAIAKINRAMAPHRLRFKEIVWFSQFSVKESVAESFAVQNRVFLVGDAAHIHSVNGGMGLNTGLGDAFNLMWKMNLVLKGEAPTTLLQTYEQERKPVAMSVIETSGALVRSTKYSEEGTHAEDYVKLVQRHAGNVTGMGIRYGQEAPAGTRLFDLSVHEGGETGRIYSRLDYARFTLLVFSEREVKLEIPASVNVIWIRPSGENGGIWAETSAYANQLLLVRPDSFIAACSPVGEEAAREIEAAWRSYSSSADWM
jgi:2-polyprenyl-6-methoxyphenol hydroxylase-like FAD-dependent oxidoreductase